MVPSIRREALHSENAARRPDHQLRIALLQGVPLLPLLSPMLALGPKGTMSIIIRAPSKNHLFERPNITSAHCLRADPGLGLLADPPWQGGV